MNVYLDLSYLLNVFINILTLGYLYLMFDYKGKLINNLMIVVFLPLIIFSLPFFKFPSFFYYLIYTLIILLIFLPRKRKYLYLLSYLLANYLLIGFLNLLTKNIIIYNQFLIITKPVSIFKCLFLFVPLLFLYAFSYLIKYQFKIIYYKMNICFIYNNNKVRIKGYYDSGNTLVYNGYPVIFIKEAIVKENSLNESCNVNYVSMNNKVNNKKGYKGEIIYKRFTRLVKKEVIFLIVADSYYFNNCDCLLNAYI